MGGWYLCRNDARADARLAQARAQFARHGFAAPQTFTTPTHRGFHVGHIHPGLATIANDGDDFIAVAGTLFYQGEGGEAALKRLLADFAPPFDRWADVLGQFGALVRKNNQLHVFADWFGGFHIYHDASHDVVSTSFLALAQSLTTLRFNRQAVYEFAFTSTPLGQDTVLDGIARLAPTAQLSLGEHVTVHQSPRRLPSVVSDEPVDTLVTRMADQLGRMFEVPARLYGDNVQCPLSGGFDSRLVLALLRQAGVRPHVYVYGSARDADVTVARHIGAAEGFDVEVFDKVAYREVTPDAFADIVAHNFHEMDATPIDGGLFDNGCNSAARHARARGGALAVSGAAGEIFRNYFYLRDRPWRSRDILDAFYAGFDPRDCTEAFDESRYFATLDAKLRAALGVEDDRLTRQQVETAYPLFRCPPFFGREISMVGRFGAYFVPFFEHAIVEHSVALPVSLRTHGVFQSQLLATIDHRLAAYPSAYGHSFVEQPGLAHRLDDAVSLYRTPAMRRWSNRMRQRLRRPAAPSGFMAPEYLGRVIDLDFPAMRAFFNVNRPLDAGLLKRIATLEYLAKSLGSRLK